MKAETVIGQREQGGRGQRSEVDVEETDDKKKQHEAAKKSFISSLKIIIFFDKKQTFSFQFLESAVLLLFSVLSNLYFTNIRVHSDSSYVRRS